MARFLALLFAKDCWAMRYGTFRHHIQLVVIHEEPNACERVANTCGFRSVPWLQMDPFRMAYTMLPTIKRHRTALKRTDLSRPAKCTLRDGLITTETSFLDYGCGHGMDVAMLTGKGIASAGWDPVFCPDLPVEEADVVQLGYVINVIEDPQERTETLKRVWGLCRRLLVVAAQVQVDGPGQTSLAFGDGVLTGIGTFQKFYGQGELKTYLEETLGVEAVPAEPGIFYLFKDETLRQQYLANRYRRRPAMPRKRASEIRFEQHRELLEGLMAALADLGRLPEADEFSQTAAVIAELGSLKKAFALVRRVTGEKEWEAIRQRRTEDLLVYLALARFRKRPALGQLPVVLQRDMRAFFGTNTKACTLADQLLFKVGDPAAIDEACKRSSIGKLLPDDLYVHRSALDTLEPLLRVYEGCGRAYLGEIEGANIIKIHRRSGKLSYLVYPDFETDPHPALLRSIRLCLRTRQLNSRDYGTSGNPPVLHRKEAFLHPEHHLREKFARLTQQEEERGLLSEPATIGTRVGWDTRLQEHGLRLQGHRLVRRKPETASTRFGPGTGDAQNS
jgi:DNA phosphorothioation-associated putative methyltransferase